MALSATKCHSKPMIVKAFEIRDAGTFIPVLAVKMVPTVTEILWPRDAVNEPERYLLRRCGYGFDPPLIMLVRMDANGGARQASYDSYGCGGCGTMTVAHAWLEKHFDAVESGAVVDVEFIQGITTAPKKSESEGPI